MRLNNERKLNQYFYVTGFQWATMTYVLQEYNNVTLMPLWECKEQLNNKISLCWTKLCLFYDACHTEYHWLNKIKFERHFKVKLCRQAAVTVHMHNTPAETKPSCQGQTSDPALIICLLYLCLLWCIHRSIGTAVSKCNGSLANWGGLRVKFVWKKQTRKKAI